MKAGPTGSFENIKGDFGCFCFTQDCMKEDMSEHSNVRL